MNHYEEYHNYVQHSGEFIKTFYPQKSESLSEQRRCGVRAVNPEEVQILNKAKSGPVD